MLKSIIVYPFVFLMWFTQKEVRIHIQWGKVDLVRFFASSLKRNSCLKIRRFVDKRHTCFPPQSQKEIKKTWKAQQMCISFAFFFNLFLCQHHAWQADFHSRRINCHSRQINRLLPLLFQTSRDPRQFVLAMYQKHIYFLHFSEKNYRFN